MSDDIHIQQYTYMDNYTNPSVPNPLSWYIHPKEIIAN